MCAFNYPSSCFETSLLLDRLGLFSAALYMPRESEFLIQLPHFVVIVAFVFANILRIFFRGFRPLYLNVLQCFANHFHVMPIGSFNRHADRNAVRFGQHASLCSVLPTVRRIWTCFFPRPTALLTLRRPSQAMTNPACQDPRNRVIPVARIPERRRLQPTPEIADRQRSKNRCPFHPMNSIDTPCEEHTELHSSHPDPALADYGNPTDAVCVAEATAPFDSTTHRECTSHHFLQPNPLLSPPLSMKGIGCFQRLLKYALRHKKKSVNNRIPSPLTLLCAFVPLC